VVDLSRRQVLKAGAAGAEALVFRGTFPGAAASGQPLAGPSTGDLRLWYDEPAGSDWLRGLRVGNGRLGAMVFGNVDTERFQLNEDTVWAGGPYDSSNPAGATAEVKLELRSLDSSVPRSTATLDMPAGWSVEPSRQELLPVGRNRSRVVTFKVMRGSAALPGEVRLTGRVDGRAGRPAPSRS
jgi:hypothetical protein